MRFNLELWKEQSSKAICFPYKKIGKKHGKETREYTIQEYRRRWENVNVDTSLAGRIALFVKHHQRKISPKESLITAKRELKKIENTLKKEKSS